MPLSKFWFVHGEIRLNVKWPVHDRRALKKKQICKSSANFIGSKNLELKALRRACAEGKEKEKKS